MADHIDILPNGGKPKAQSPPLLDLLPAEEPPGTEISNRGIVGDWSPQVRPWLGTELNWGMPVNYCVREPHRGLAAEGGYPEDAPKNPYARFAGQ